MQQMQRIERVDDIPPHHGVAYPYGCPGEDRFFMEAPRELWRPEL